MVAPRQPRWPAIGVRRAAPKGRRRGGALAALLGAAASGCSLLEGCSGNHSHLGNDDPTPGPPAGGAGGGSTSAAGGASSGAGGAGGVDAGPPGPTKLTIVNGVTDYDAIRICFVPYPGRGGGLPWPAAATGLAFAGARVIDPIDQVIPEGVDVRAFVLAGDLAQTDGKSCTEILAAAGGEGATLQVAPLAVLPASVFTSHKSVLFVPTGCLGGPGHAESGGAEVLGCGRGYTATTPTSGLVALGMSREKNPSAVALQVVHASAAMPVVDVGISPGTAAAVERRLASSLTPGAIGPQPPFMDLTSAALGVLGEVVLKTYAPGTSSPTSAVLLEAAFANGGLNHADVVDGAAMVLVAVGGSPGLPAGPFWHAHTYVMVRADPP